MRCVRQSESYPAYPTFVVGWDFSTGGVKCIAFDLEGNTLADVRLPTDLWTEGGVSELSLLQLEGQVYASVRELRTQLEDKAVLITDWLAGGISATHHTAGRITGNIVPVRRAICWNDHSLAPYHARGLERLGGQEKVVKAIGGPWAIRYTLSHLVKDEETLSPEDWKRSSLILPHGPLAAGFLTGEWERISVSSAASTGIMNLKTCRWSKFMLGALENPQYRKLAWEQLPSITDQSTPIGELTDEMKNHADIGPSLRIGRRKKGEGPWIFPTSDDQAAGLVGGGAVDAGQMAIILGNSAVVNSSSNKLPTSDNLDAMRLNWGPYLWMRCYNNGAQFLDRVLGPKPDWERLEAEARGFGAGADGVTVLPFVAPEPSLGVSAPRVQWSPREPRNLGQKYRAALEALAYLIALGVREHEAAGQRITRISVSGGIARSDLMCEILATVLDRQLERLQSDEGPALGAAVTALAGLETYLRHKKRIVAPYTVADAVAQMVKFRDPVKPNTAWREAYQTGLREFEVQLKSGPR
ncbi:MAG: xylulose kinase [Gemmataceae bacterium]|nr:xylulose kinase [Gemmataceae bacterium]